MQYHIVRIKLSLLIKCYLSYNQHTETFPRACKTHKLVDTPQKVKKFLVGRQFFTIFVVFLISQISSFPHIPKDFGGLPPAMVLILFQIGLPGVALVLTYGQLVSQIFVEEFTLQFLNLPGCEFVVRLSLGKCNGSESYSPERIADKC